MLRKSVVFLAPYFIWNTNHWQIVTYLQTYCPKQSGNSLFFKYNVFNVVYVFCHLVVDSAHIFDFVARIQNGGVVSSAQFFAYRNKGEGEKFTHKITADLPRNDYFFFLALACNIVFSEFVVTRNRIDYAPRRDFFLSALGYGFVQSRLGKRYGDRLLVQLGGEDNFRQPAFKRSHVVARILRKKLQNVVGNVAFLFKRLAL